MEDTQKRNLPVQRILNATLDVAGFRKLTGSRALVFEPPRDRAIRHIHSVVAHFFSAVRAATMLAFARGMKTHVRPSKSMNHDSHGRVGCVPTVATFSPT